MPKKRGQESDQEYTGDQGTKRYRRHLPKTKNKLKRMILQQKMPTVRAAKLLKINQSTAKMQKKHFIDKVNLFLKDYWMKYGRDLKVQVKSGAKGSNRSKRQKKIKKIEVKQETKVKIEPVVKIQEQKIQKPEIYIISVKDLELLSYDWDNLSEQSYAKCIWEYLLTKNQCDMRFMPQLPEVKLQQQMI